MDVKTFNDTIEKIRGNIGADLSASNSEDFLALVGAYNEMTTNLEDSRKEVDDLNTKNKELLETNGRLFQKIGFEKATYNNSNHEEKHEEKNIEITDLINEKGEFI